MTASPMTACMTRTSTCPSPEPHRRDQPRSACAAQCPPRLAHLLGTARPARDRSHPVLARRAHPARHRHQSERDRVVRLQQERRPPPPLPRELAVAEALTAGHGADIGLKPPAAAAAFRRDSSAPRRHAGGRRCRRHRGRQGSEPRAARGGNRARTGAAFPSLAQQGDACFVRHGDFFQQPPRAFGIGAHALGAERRKSRALFLARGGDAGAHLGAALARRRQHEIGGGDGRHLDLQVDAVEQRPRDARLVVVGAAWSALAGLSRRASTALARVMAASLDARGVGDAMDGARDHLSPASSG